MIGKLVTGKSFKGAVEYVMNKPGARLLCGDGVDETDARSVTRSFDFQRKARPEKERVVGHISLSFHPDDAPKLSDDMMRTLADEYMRRMEITDTQYIVVRHTDTENPHLHIIYNRVKYNAKLVRTHDNWKRNAETCKAMKRKYGLTFSEGKQAVKVEKLHGPEKIKYTIYETVKGLLPHLRSLKTLADELAQKGIVTVFVHRGADPDKEVQGLTFAKDGVTFKASQIDRKFSSANLCKRIDANREAERKRQEQERRQRRPEVFGVRLTDEHIRAIRDGEPVYLEGMRHEGETVDGYLVMDDTLRYGRAYVEKDPREWVRYGEYTMRRMDCDLIRAGFVVRALVQWWGGMGETARPYLWKQSPTDAEYKESWEDPRKLRKVVERAEKQIPEPILKRSRGRGL